jgi:membrane protease YdiL (CAAX protease family)
MFNLKTTNIKNIILYAILPIFIYIIFFSIMSYIIHKLGYNLQTNNSHNTNYSDLYSIFSITILAPIIEETVFRYPLRFKYNSSIYWYCIMFIWGLLSAFHFLPRLFALLSVVVLVSVFIILLLSKWLGQYNQYISQLNQKIVTPLDKIIKKYNLFFVILSIIAFYMIHVQINFDASLQDKVSALLIPLSALTLCLYFTYLRLYFDKGLLISIIAHFFNNSLLILILLISSIFL